MIVAFEDVTGGGRAADIAGSVKPYGLVPTLNVGLASAGPQSLKTAVGSVEAPPSPSRGGGRLVELCSSGLLPVPAFILDTVCDATLCYTILTVSGEGRRNSGRTPPKASL